MQHITASATIRRPNRFRRPRGNAVIAAGLFWLAGFLSALATIIITGR